MGLLEMSDAYLEASRPSQGERRRRRWPRGLLVFFLIGVLAGLVHARLLGLI